MADDRFIQFLRLVEGGGGLFDAEAERVLGPVWGTARAAGFVRPTTPSPTAGCPECAGAQVGRVHYLANRVTGATTPYMACPDCGLIDVPEAALRRSLVDEPAFVAAVGRALGTFPGAATQVGPTAWYLGRIPSFARSKVAYLVLRVRPKDQGGLNALLATRPKAVLFFPTPAAVAAWPSDMPEVRLPLTDYLTLIDDRLAFDGDGLAALLRDDAGVRQKRVTGKGVRPKQIRELKRVLEDRARAARDHAYSARDRTGTPLLLPRLTREEFGALAGLSKTQTSHCFNHPDAEEVRLLYDLLADLDWVMSRPP
jgi:hypothetical protein